MAKFKDFQGLENKAIFFKDFQGGGNLSHEKSLPLKFTKLPKNSEKEEAFSGEISLKNSLPRQARTPACRKEKPFLVQ